MGSVLMSSVYINHDSDFLLNLIMTCIACMTATFYVGGQWRLADSLSGPIVRKHDESLTKKKVECICESR